MADVSRRVSLIFEADTSAAKNSINELVRSLQSIQSKPTDLVNTDSIKTASKAALELQEHLRKAVNVDTGRLDLSRFVTSLNSSKKTLEDYRVALNRIGPEGNRAFIQLAHNINNSETSTVRLNKTMQNFLNTLKNTVKWQISSNITHGLESTISHAYNYAKQLDGVLNDIRIVSGKSAEEMANFAVAANRSAQELSTTTSKYAEASLIFFQQGLSDAAVKERTDAVIKMASVTGEAMTDVSSYMTAIWNNFADGTKNLEYYSDVIVKLGADTASSSEEIAGGLEKFIAIGDQIGLSYEYAAAALTTITAQTRQSEDVVGTALRTIFARIQGLNLGETLDDGTTLNKYSSALQKVGVDIKDASGQLKDMDIILDDLGSKWGTLSKDTQVALAQTVGGVRQYNQIIALMDNWEFFQKNLQTAYSSEGSLDKQFGIYEESWRAAEQRVKAAAEGIYDALLDEKIFIQLDGFFTGLLNVVQGIVEGMGGMVPILATIGGFITTKFAKEMPVIISNFKENLAIFSGKSGTKALEEQSKLTENLQKKLRATKPGTEEAAELTSLERVSRMREELLKNQKNMNSAQIEEYENLIKVEQAIGRINTERAKGIEQSRLQAQESASLLEDEIDIAAFNASEDYFDTELIRERLVKDEFSKAQESYDSQDEVKKIVDEVYTDDYLKKYLSGKIKDKDSKLDNIIKNEEFKSKNQEKRDSKEANMAEGLKEQKEQLISYSKASGQATAELTKLKNLQNNVFKNKDIKDNTEKIELGLKGAKQALQELQKIASDSNLGTEGLEVIEKSINGIEEKAKSGTLELEDLEQVIVDLINASSKYKTDAAKSSNQAAQNLKNAGVNAEVVDKAQRDAHMAGTRGQAYPVETGEGTPIEELKKGTPGAVETLTELAGAAMEVYGAFQAVQGAWETLNNPDASGLEKIGAILGGIMSITMALNGIVSFSNVLAQTSFYNSIKNAAAKTAEAGATGFLSIAVRGLAKANAALMAFSPALWATLAIGAVVGVIAVIGSLINRETEQEKKLRILKEESEALGAAQENLEQHIEDVQSAWDNYQSMVDALNECTVGTEAWNEALINCNQSVLSLIALAPGLSQFVKYNEDGSLSLGGIGYEEYMQELTRQNQAVQASKMIADNKIAQIELDSYYGDQKIYDSISGFLLENNVQDMYEKDFEKFYFGFAEAVYDAYGKDVSRANEFLENVGYSSGDFDTLHGYYTNTGSEQSLYDYYKNSGLNYNFVMTPEPNKIFSNMERWSQDLLTYNDLENTNRAAYSTLFGALQGYDVDNLGVYGVRFEEAIQEALEDETKGYSTEDESTLRQLMVETFKGTLEDYEEMSIDSMQYALAVADVSNNLDVMNGIITNTNKMLSSLNSAGQSLIRNGNLSAASLAELGAVGESASKLIEPLEWTLKERNGLEEVKGRGTIDSSGISFAEFENLQTAVNIANSAYQASLRLPWINTRLSEIAEQEEARDELADSRKGLESALQTALDMTDDYLEAYSTNLSMQSPTTSPAERQDFANYDLWRAQLPNASENGWLFGIEGFIEVESERERLERQIASLEEQYGQEYLSSRPELTVEQAQTNIDRGVSTSWIEPSEVVVNWVDPTPEILETINQHLINSGIGITATEESLINGSFQEEILSILSDTTEAQADSEKDEEWKRILEERDSLSQERSTLLSLAGAWGWTEESLTSDNIDFWEGVEYSLHDMYSAEDANAILEALKDNQSLESVLYKEDGTARYIPKDVYADFTHSIEETLGDRFGELLIAQGLGKNARDNIDNMSENRAVSQFRNMSERAQYETLSTQQAIYDSQRLLNEEQENIVKQILGISENMDLFQGMRDLGLIEEDIITGQDYVADWERARTAALEVDPEAIYRSEMLQRLGVDEGEYIIDPENAEITRENAEKFAEEFGILSAEEIADGVSWEEIATRFNELVIEAMEQALSGWNSNVSKRFQTQLEVGEEGTDDEGKFVLPDGVTEAEMTAADKLFLALSEAGASSQLLDAFTDTIDTLAPALTTEQFEDMSDTMIALAESTGEADKVLSFLNNVLEQTQQKGSSLNNEEIIAVAKETGVYTIDLADDIGKLGDVASIAADSISNLSEGFNDLLSTLDSLQKLVDITTGTELSEEEYEAIKNYIPEEYQDLFMRTIGGYTFYGTDKQGKFIEEVARGRSWDDYTGNKSEVQSFGEAARFEDDGVSLEDSNFQYSAINWLFGGKHGIHNGDFMQFVAQSDKVQAGYMEVLNGLSLEDFDESGKYIGEDETGETQAAITAVLDLMSSYLRGDFEGLTTEEAQLQLTGIQSRDELNAAIASGDIVIGNEEGQISEEQLENFESGLIDEEIESAGFNTEEIEEYGKYLQDIGKISKDLTDNELKDLTLAIARQERGVKNLQENWKDYANILTDETKKGTKEYSDTLEDLIDIAEDITGMNLSDFDKEFLSSEEALEKFAAAAEGGEEEVRELQEYLTDEQLRIFIKPEDKGIESELLNMLDTAQALLAGQDIELGATLDSTGLTDALQEIINQAGLTTEQANELLSGLGFEPEITEVPVTLDETSSSKGNYVYNYTDPITGETLQATTHTELTAGEDGQVTLPIINGSKTHFKGFGSGSSRRRGGGGGGGGGGGSRAPRAERKTNKDKDRYRTVKNQLEDLTDSYDKVSTAADRAFGETKLKLLKQQEKAIQDLISKQHEYIDEINEYYDIDRKAVEEVSSRLGFAVEFDANGTITNWDEIQDKMIEEYNSHINDKGEVIGMDEEAWSEYEKEWERVMELFNQYDETQDLRKEALQQLQDYANQLYDLQLQEVTYVVEIKIDATDDALEILDYMLGRIEDDAWAAAEAIAYMGQKAAEIQLQNNTYTEGIRGILMNHTRDLVDSEGNIVNSASLTVEDVEGFMNGQEAAIKKIMALNEEFTDEEVQQLREYNSSLIEMNETLNELRNEVFDKVLDSFEAFNDEMDRSIDKIDHLSSLTENYANIIDIVGQKNLEISNALMESISQATVDQATNRVEATREKMLTIQDEIARAEEALADAKSKGLEEDVKLWEDTLKEMNDSLDEAEEEFLQSWEDALTAAAEAFEASMNRAISSFSDALAGPLLGSLEQLEEMFDRQNTIADRYLPDYEKIYELNKLNRDITNSIDDTDNIRAKQELAALQEEINRLEEDGVQVSEYQIENLRRRYELKLAELALTESQNAKSEVRMSRNADGDWSYVYVADEEQVAEAEQNYEDKLFAMQQANAEYINNLNDMIIQMETELTAKLEEIANDETLSQEEKMARMNETIAFYQEQMGYYMDELGLVLGENQILYEQDWAKYSELTGYKISANEAYVDHFNETALSLLTGYETMEEFQRAFNDAIGHPDSGGLLYDLDNAFKTWEANMEEVFESAGTSMDDFSGIVEDSVNDIVENSDEAAESIEEMGDTVVSTFDEITSAVQNWSNVYSETIDSILARNEMLAKSFNELLKAWAGFEEATEVEEGTAPGEDEEVDTGDLEGGDGQTEEDKGKIQDGDAVYIAEGTPGIADWAEGPGRRYYAFYRNNAGKRAVGSGVWYVTVDPKNKKWDGYIGRIHEKYLRKFDTGGYTGSWGAEGRVAMLHEKELVLNKQDTSNLLAAVGMIRDISKIIDLNAYASSYGNITSTPNVVDNTGTLEQQVNITAEFPNATDKDEILSAFDDIINLASQYANRR